MGNRKNNCTSGINIFYHICKDLKWKQIIAVSERFDIVLDKLDRRQAEIIKARYDREGDKVASYRKIADKLGMNSRYINAEHQRAILNLMTPEMQILIKQLAGMLPEDHQNNNQENISIKKVGIESLNLSRRAYFSLKNEGINNVDELKNMTAEDLLKIRNFGITCLKEVRSKMNSTGMQLKSSK